MKNVIIGLALGLSVSAAFAGTSYCDFVFSPGEVVTAAKLNQEFYRVSVLERKVEGMQKQITLLHAKKADKITSMGVHTVNFCTEN